MFEFFRALGDTIVGLVNFIIMMVEGLLRFLGMLPTATSFLTNTASNVPLFVAPFVAIGISVPIVLMILGRNSHA